MNAHSTTDPTKPQAHAAPSGAADLRMGSDQSAGFIWNDSYLLGYGPMDDTHREFVDVVQRLSTCADADLASHLAEFRVHAEAHFDMENQWMRDTDFPPRDCHIDEHAAVMGSVKEVQDLLANGNLQHVGIARNLIAELINWFPGHAIHLDSALSHWMVKRSHGGKPVVFRKKADILPPA